MAAQRFLFDTDFRNPRPSTAQAKAAADVAEIEAAAHARGVAEGRREGEAQASARLADAVNRLALAATALLADTDSRHGAIETEAVGIAVTLAGRIAGEALDAAPLVAVGEAVREALRHARGVPHLAVRVNEALVEETEALLRKQARERGYDGRLVVLGEPDIPVGDARIEWADGGVVRERARLDNDVASALADALPH